MSRFTINTWWLCTRAPPHPIQRFPFGPKHSWVRHCAELYWKHVLFLKLAVKLKKTAPMSEQTPGDKVLPAAEYVPDVSSHPGPDLCGMESSGSQTAGRSASGRSESAHVDTRDRRAPRPVRARGGDANGPLSSNRVVGGRSGARLRRVGKIKGRKSADGSGPEAAGTRGMFTDVFPRKRGPLTAFYHGEKLQVSWEKWECFDFWGLGCIFLATSYLQEPTYLGKIPPPPLLIWGLLGNYSAALVKVRVFRK